MRRLYILILILILLSGCNRSNICEHNHQPLKIEYIEKYCPNCNGVGKVKLSTGERVLWGVVTFGGGFMFETMECDVCRGTGVIKVRKLNNE